MQYGLRIKKKSSIYLWIAIPVIFYLIFLMLPIIMSLFYSFFDWKGGKNMKFIGFKNYIRLMKDDDFWHSVWNNIWLMFLSLVFNTVLAYFLALAVSSKFVRLRKFYRFTIFLPVILSGIVVGYLWKMIYNEVPGLLNTLLGIMGLSEWKHLWLGDSKIAMTSISFIRIWKVMGMHLVVYLASLQNISQDVLDAAEVDGASGFKKIRYIITPMMLGTIRVSILLSIADSLKIFDIIYSTSKGGPGNASSVMSFLTYRTGFEFFKLGYSNAMAIASVIIGGIIVGAVNYFAGKGENKFGE